MNDDSALISSLQNSAQREKSFVFLISKYKERLYWQIRNIVLDHDDADDVLQNTFIKIYKNISSFKGESSLHTWMYRIATNEAITFLSKKAKRNNISIELVKENAIKKLESDVYFEGDEIQLKLQNAIAALPPKQQLVFNMKYFEELTYVEISEILETSVGALKSSYHIAVKKVKEFVDPN